MMPNMNDDIYASRELFSELPKTQFPAKEQNARNVFSVVRDELMLDGNSRQNLATFCQTEHVKIVVVSFMPRRVFFDR